MIFKLENKLNIIFVTFAIFFIILVITSIIQKLFFSLVLKNTIFWTGLILLYGVKLDSIYGVLKRIRN